MWDPAATAAMMRDYAARARASKSGKYRGYTADRAERIAIDYDYLTTATPEQVAAHRAAKMAEARRGK